MAYHQGREGEQLELDTLAPAFLLVLHAYVRILKNSKDLHMVMQTPINSSDILKEEKPGHLTSSQRNQAGSTPACGFSMCGAYAVRSLFAIEKVKKLS